MQHDQVIPVTVDGGFHSGDALRIVIRDAANGSLMLELDLDERTVLDLIRNRSRDENTATLRVVGKGLDAHGLVREHGQLVIHLAGYGQGYLDAALAELDAALGSDEGWSFDRQWNGHRIERLNDGSYDYRLWARRLVRPAVIERWPSSGLNALADCVVRWEPGAHAQ